MKNFFAAIGIFLFNWLVFQPFAVSTTLLPLIVSAQAVFIAALLKHTAQKWIRISIMLALAAAFIYLAVSKSRAAWLGMSAGLLVIACLRGVLSNRKRAGLLFGGLVFAIITATFFVKTGSSKGRLLIYKVIFDNITAHDLFTGIGPGKFSADYNTWQAKYFERHNINSREALLADNTFFAFNDYLQVIIEWGMTGLVIIIAAVALFLFALRRLKIKPEKTGFPAGAAAAITTLAVAALFTYPFQNWWIIAFSLVCTGILLYTITKRRVYKNTLAAFFLLLSAVCSYHARDTDLREQAKHKALELVQMGYKQEGLNRLRQLTNNWPRNGHILFLYAKELYMAGQPDSALVYLTLSTRYINSLESCRLFARIFDEQGNTANAERYYLQAVYMVPNRFESRYELVRFYEKVGDTGKAKYWACCVLQLPVKVASEKVDSIKSYCREFLREENIICVEEVSREQ